VTITVVVPPGATELLIGATVMTLEALAAEEPEDVLAQATRAVVSVVRVSIILSFIVASVPKA